ncbi:LLM class flavin-dependent oxidoreductase [Actinokineospora sp. HUAS TT18]|uniref:LLM class flavin-dependent oxidoreductase n=1 Tax=Actinokineospora sp. HUAS TT18 TaxID=3447451 RepID=UPI003F522160
MRLGVFLLAGRFPGQTDQDALDRARLAVGAAEQAGLDDVWFAEHHFMPYGVCPDALTFAAYALGATRRVGVGTAVSVLSTAHPVALGERALLLNGLAGRLTLGVGRGGPWVDLEVFGDVDRYERGFADGIDLLTDTLRGPTARGDAWFPFREVPIVPATTPPPVVVACTSTATVDLAASRGLPMLLGMHIGDDDKRALITRYGEKGGPPDAEHVSAVVAHIADSRDQAVAEVMAALPGWLRDGLAAHRTVDGRPRPSRDPHAYARLLCDLHPVGDLDYCVRALRTHAHRTGVRRIIAMADVTGDAGRTLRTVDLLGTRVLPALRTPPGSDLGKLA